MSDKKTTMLDLAGSPSFNYEAAADALNTSNTNPSSKNKNRRNIHLALAAAGMTPGPVGFGADFVDALLYTVEGKFGDAALSSVAMIPFVGQIAAAKRSVDKVIDAGDEYLYVYRGLNTKGPDFATGLPRQFDPDDMVVDILGTPTHVGGNFRLSGGLRKKSQVLDVNNPQHYIERQMIDSPGFAHIFDIDNANQVQFASEVFTTTSPVTAINYAMGQGLQAGMHSTIKSEMAGRLGTVIRYKIPISHIKKIANTELPSGQMALNSNDYFLKKFHNVGTGRNLPVEMEMAQSFDPRGYTIGFRNTPETRMPDVRLRDSVSKRGNNIVRFDLGVPAVYADKIWENKNISEFLKEPELMTTSYKNKSIQDMLRNRNLPRDNALSFMDEEYAIDSETLKQVKEAIEFRKANNTFTVPRDI